MKILFLLCICNFFPGSVFGQMKVITAPSLQGYSHEDIKLPCDASLNRNDIRLMWITWIQNATKVYEYDGSSGKQIVEIPGYDIDLKQVEQGDIALTIARNTLTPGVYTFKCEVTEGSAEGRGETTLTVRAPPQILTVNAARSVTVKELPYDLTCSVPNLRWNKVEKMTLTWKENGKDLCFFDGSNSDAQQSKKCHCVECYPSLCLLTLRDAHISDVNYTCIVTEGNAEGNAAIEVTFKAPPQILTVNAARSVTVKELPYDLTCSVPNLRWNKVERMTLTWKENGKDLCFFDGSNSDAQQSKKCHCVKSYPSLCLLSLTDAHISDVNYTCIVTEGNAEGTATIAVKFKD